MFSSLRHLIGWILSAFGSRKDLVLENLALRQQLLAFHTKRPRRRLSTRHKLFWVLLRKVWSEWQKPLILVTPRNVGGVAPRWLSAVLEMALQNQTSWRPQEVVPRKSTRPFKIEPAPAQIGILGCPSPSDVLLERTLPKQSFFEKLSCFRRV